MCQKLPSLATRDFGSLPAWGTAQVSVVVARFCKRATAGVLLWMGVAVARRLGNAKHQGQMPPAGHPAAFVPTCASTLVYLDERESFPMSRGALLRPVSRSADPPHENTTHSFPVVRAAQPFRLLPDWSHPYKHTADQRTYGENESRSLSFQEHAKLFEERLQFVAGRASTGTRRGPTTG
jgi:hypothetical protein